MSTIYFTTDFIVENSRENIILLSVVSFLSASLPLLNSKLIPKTCADNFYKGAITLEQGIMKHKEKLITTKELLETYEKAERLTNPGLDKND